MGTETSRSGDPEARPGHHDEPRTRPAGASRPSLRDAWALLVRSVKEAMRDNVTDRAAALAYYGFLAIPAFMLLALGIFGVVASPADVQSLMERLSAVIPQEAVDLLQESLDRVVASRGSGWTLIVVGLLLGLWTATGATTALMRALNEMYRREESRGFVRQRLVALILIVWLGLAALLVFGLLVLGPHLTGWIGDAVDNRGAVGWIWWTAQWPVMVFGLLLAFAGVLWLGPDRETHRWRLFTAGAAVTVVLWLVFSGGFAVYVSMFGSYNKTWGSLAAIVILLVWIWVSALALLIGAKVNATIEQSRGSGAG